jgi:hypothetical protein
MAFRSLGPMFEFGKDGLGVGLVINTCMGGRSVVVGNSRWKTVVVG